MKNKLMAIFVIALIVVGYLYWGLKNEKEIREITKIEIKEDEKSKVIFDPIRREVKQITRVGNPSGSDNPGSVRVETIKGVRDTSVTVKESGEIVVRSVNKGPTLNFGPALFFSEDRLFGGVDAEIFYWKNTSASAGVGLDLREGKKVRGYVAVGFTPRFRYLSNTKFDVGITTEKEFKAGVSWRF